MDQAPVIDVDVVGLWRRLPVDGFRHKRADLLRRQRIGHIDNAHPAGKPISTKDVFDRALEFNSTLNQTATFKVNDAVHA